MADQLSWVRVRRTPSKPIATYKALADALDGGKKRVLRTNTPTGPVFTLENGRTCTPSVVKGALANGWLRPCDRGLFDGTAQSFVMGVHHGEY